MIQKPIQMEGESDRAYIGRLIAYINILENDLFWYHELDDCIDGIENAIDVLKRNRRIKE